MSTIFWKNEIDFYRISLSHKFIETSSTRKYSGQVIKGRAQQNPFEQTVTQIKLAAFFWIGGSNRYRSVSSLQYYHLPKYYNLQWYSKLAVAAVRSTSHLHLCFIWLIFLLPWLRGFGPQSDGVYVFSFFLNGFVYQPMLSYNCFPHKFTADNSDIKFATASIAQISYFHEGTVLDFWSNLLLQSVWLNNNIFVSHVYECWWLSTIHRRK